MIELTGLP